MSISYPSQLDDFENPQPTDSRSEPSLAGQQSDQNDAIEALEAKVGVNSSAVTSSHDYKITQLETKTAGATTAEIGYLSGVTSAIQTQLNTKITNNETTTFTNKRITPRITTITSHATPTINTDNCDAVTITAQEEAITSMTTNLSGTPTNFQKLLFRIKDDGTGRAITWGDSFEAVGVALPTTTTANKRLIVGFIYDTVTSKWGCVASVEED
jgi:hypothetical protein